MFAIMVLYWPSFLLEKLQYSELSFEQLIELIKELEGLLLYGHQNDATLQIEQLV